MFPPAHLVQLPSMATNETLAALAARLQAPPSGELPLPDASLASMAPVVPFDVQALAESLTAVLAAPLPSGAVSHTAPKTTHSKHRASGRSSSSNTSQGGSLGAISSLSKGTSGSRGGGRLDPQVVSLQYLEDEGLLVLPENDAAARLGVGVNTLKRHCRYVVHGSSGVPVHAK